MAKQTRKTASSTPAVVIDTQARIYWGQKYDAKKGCVTTTHGEGQTVVVTADDPRLGTTGAIVGSGDTAEAAILDMVQRARLHKATLTDGTPLYADMFRVTSTEDRRTDEAPDATPVAQQPATVSNPSPIKTKENAMKTTTEKTAAKAPKATKKPVKAAVAVAPAAPAKKPIKAAPAEKPAAAPKGGQKKDGLRNPQVRILQCLSKSKTGLTYKEICEKAGTDPASGTSLMGSSNPEIRAKNDARKFPSLLTLKAVKHDSAQQDGKEVTIYSITATGKALLAKSE